MEALITQRNLTFFINLLVVYSSKEVLVMKGWFKISITKEKVTIFLSFLETKKHISHNYYVLSSVATAKFQNKVYFFSK